jgi:hypothetical protein
MKKLFKPPKARLHELPVPLGAIMRVVILQNPVLAQARIDLDMDEDRFLRAVDDLMHAGLLRFTYNERTQEYRHEIHPSFTLDNWPRA